MTDLEMTRKCAERMGINEVPWNDGPGRLDIAMPEGCIHYLSLNGKKLPYWPLHDDAQAMALIRKFGMDVRRDENGDWNCVIKRTRNAPGAAAFRYPDLNRAIVVCVSGLK